MDESSSERVEHTEELPIVRSGERKALHLAGVFFLELIKIIILAGITIFVVRHFLFRPFSVKGQSMSPNYEPGEYLIVGEFDYRVLKKDPERGEAIVFRAPVGNRDYYLKRIIGMPGERVKIEDGKVIIYNQARPEGVVLDEPYIDEDTPGAVNLTVGVDEYFVLGDNRDKSFDSRNFGAISKESIVGQTWLRGWPFTRVQLFDHPSYPQLP